MANFNIVCPANRTFALWSQAIKDCLEKLGHNVTIQNRINASKADVELVNAPNKFGSFVKTSGVKYVALQGEQLMLKHCKDNWLTRNWLNFQKCEKYYDVIWDTFKPMHDHLYQKPSYHFKLGYHELFDWTFNDIQPIYDVSFLGSLNERRQSILNSIKPKVRTHSNPIDGDDRIRFLLESKIHLNLHYVDTGLLATLRAIFVMCNKRLLISEPFLGEDDLRPYIIEVKGEANEFNVAIEKYLCDKRIVEDAYQYLRCERTMLNSIVNLLDYL